MQKKLEVTLKGAGSAPFTKVYKRLPGLIPRDVEFNCCVGEATKNNF